MRLGGGGPGDERPPRPGLHQLGRSLLGGLLIALLTAGAVATAALLEVKDLVDRFNPDGAPISDEGITRAEAGQPRTFLILGSDRRFDELKKNNPALEKDVPARSDTMMLVRLDPDQAATTVLSLPRDLKVRIPGYGTDKLNASYSLGGPTLTVKTIKEFTGLDINHVVNINFGGFREVVNAIGCVYIDVDRRYYHSNEGLPVSAHYAEIDLQPGYDKLCGTDALSYVRFRHLDSDIVRAARQQAFLRQAKDQLNASSLIDNRDELVEIFAENTQTDRSLQSSAALLSVLKLALFSASHPIRQIEFPAQYEDDVYVVASREDVERVVDEFLHPGRREAPREVQLTPDAKPRTINRPDKEPESPQDVPGLVNGQRMGADQLAETAARTKLPFDIYFPKYVTSSSRYESEKPVRVYKVANRAGEYQRAYRLALSHNIVEGQYWGVQGTDWPTPPILDAPHQVVERHGRKLGVYRDGSRIHLVSWRHDGAVYWVKNTLSNHLTNTQMLEIASTLTNDFS